MNKFTNITNIDYVQRWQPLASYPVGAALYEVCFAFEDQDDEKEYLVTKYPANAEDCKKLESMFEKYGKEKYKKDCAIFYHVAGSYNYVTGMF